MHLPHFQSNRLGNANTEPSVFTMKGMHSRNLVSLSAQHLLRLILFPLLYHIFPTLALDLIQFEAVLLILYRHSHGVVPVRRLAVIARIFLIPFSCSNSPTKSPGYVP